MVTLKHLKYTLNPNAACPICAQWAPLVYHVISVIFSQWCPREYFATTRYSKGGRDYMYKDNTASLNLPVFVIEPRMFNFCYCSRKATIIFTGIYIFTSTIHTNMNTLHIV